LEKHHLCFVDSSHLHTERCLHLSTCFLLLSGCIIILSGMHGQGIVTLLLFSFRTHLDIFYLWLLFMATLLDLVFLWIWRFVFFLFVLFAERYPLIKAWFGTIVSGFGLALYIPVSAVLAGSLVLFCGSSVNTQLSVFVLHITWVRLEYIGITSSLPLLSILPCPPFIGL
jgi:hypothetical protein